MNRFDWEEFIVEARRRADAIYDAADARRAAAAAARPRGPSHAMNAATKERPISLMAPFVLGLLDGSKTRTTIHAGPVILDGDESGQGWEPTRPCRLGRPGDRLWVKETWRRTSMGGDDGDIPAAQYRADKLRRCVCPPEDRRWSVDDRGWKPSRFMPRWAARLVLEITDVRLQWSLDITDAEIAAEGLELYAEHRLLIRAYNAGPDRRRVLWEDLWDENNPEHPFRINQPTYVVEFKVVEGRRD